MNLAQMQRDFTSWLTLNAPDAAARLGKHNGAALAVYRNNYRLALGNCLADNFQAVLAWLGDAAFERAVCAHIDRRPPHSWTLDAYALQFPETLDALYPEDPEVADLACLERDLGLAFVGPDAELLDVSDLEHSDWESAVLTLVPTFSLLPMRSNAAAIWSAIRADRSPPAASRSMQPLVLALWRKGFSSAFRALEPLELQAISMVSEGSRFADICAAVAAQVGEEQAAQTAGDLLGRWMRDGMMARMGPTIGS